MTALIRTHYYIVKFTDEWVPCDCTPSGWAKWLSNPDEEWGRDTPAQDGDTFSASAMTETTVVARKNGEAWMFSPPIPDDTELMVVKYGRDLGWDATDMVDAVPDLIKSLEFEGGSGMFVACLKERPGNWTATYRVIDGNPVVTFETKPRGDA